jgi:flagellar M-ring protein FliF
MDQLTKLISGLTLTQRISIIVLALAVGAGIFAFAHYRHEGDFRPLYTSMAPEDAATVVQKLRETGVEYRLSDDGGSVMVPSKNLAESRLTLAQAGLPKTGRIGFELFDKSNFGATEFVEHINYKRALEGELERSVMSLAEVETARVHLTLSKESVFLEQQQPAKASVMVKLKPGAQISSQNVQAVTNLVASAVEGLSPEAVSVVDMDGTLLNRPRKPAAEDGSEISSESLEMRQQIEKALVAKISQTLEPLLGANGFRAGASVDYDLTSGEQQEETLDPAKSVMLSSQKTEDVVDRAGTSGIPGTASNLPAPNTATAKAPAGTARRTENITYQTSRTIRHTRIPQGVIKRMSLAILVDQSVQWEGDGANRKRVLVPPPPETLKTIRELVAGVTGFDGDRGDQLIVETLPFESSLHAEPPKINKPAPTTKPVKNPPWLEFLNKYRDLWTPAGIGLVVLMVLGIWLFRTKKRTVAQVSVEEQAELEAAGEQTELAGGAHRQLEKAEELPELVVVKDAASELAERVRQFTKKEPVITANVLRLWLMDSKG